MNHPRLLQAYAHHNRHHQIVQEKFLRYFPLTYKGTPANKLTKQVIDFLTWSGHQAERISTTGRAIDQTVQVTDVLGRTRTIGGVKWIPTSGTRGSADISATIKPQGQRYAIPVKIEVKIGRDRQSEDQKTYQERIEQSGGVYWIVREFDQFISLYDQLMEATP